jgi:hypothetical protein
VQCSIPQQHRRSTATICNRDLFLHPVASSYTGEIACESKQWMRTRKWSAANLRNLWASASTYPDSRSDHLCGRKIRPPFPIQSPADYYAQPGGRRREGRMLVFSTVHVMQAHAIFSAHRTALRRLHDIANRQPIFLRRGVNPAKCDELANERSGIPRPSSPFVPLDPRGTPVGNLQDCVTILRHRAHLSSTMPRATRGSIEYSAYGSRLYIGVASSVPQRIKVRVPFIMSCSANCMSRVDIRSLPNFVRLVPA